jgi:hypothetical protein
VACRSLAPAGDCGSPIEYCGASRIIRQQPAAIGQRIYSRVAGREPTSTSRCPSGSALSCGRFVKKREGLVKLAELFGCPIS